MQSNSVPQSRGVIRLARALIFVSLGAALQSLHAQIGNDNPTGPAGVFGGLITTGCAYSPYTGSAMRSVTDLLIANGASTYPLAFTRVSNSRQSDWGRFQFGPAGGWQHSYAWTMAPSPESSSSTALPASYEVFFPDGRDENFTSSGSRAVAGIGDRVQPQTQAVTGALAFLILSDGGKVEFKATKNSRVVSGTTYAYWYTYQAQALIDPHGLYTAFSYYADGSLYQITEPAGRWIRLFYMTTPWYNSNQFQDRVIDHITGSDGRSVQYGYAIAGFAPGAFPFRYTYLEDVTYYGDSTVKAFYTYQPPNVPTNGSYNGFPLLGSCDDPMYEGPMKKISYTYATSNGVATLPVAVGQIYSENSGTTGQIVSRLHIPYITWRTEIRGDGPSRFFSYNGPYVYQADDFNAKPAFQAQDGNGFLNYFKDRNGNVTNLTREPLTGNIMTVTFPLTPNDTPTGTPRGIVTSKYGAASNNYDPHYLYSVTDEGNNTTVYNRDLLQRIFQINYPDTGYETFGYTSSLGQVTSHRLKTGGTETFAYYLTANGDPAYLNGLLKEYRDPYHATGNPNARYQYDTLGRLTGVTDALGTALGDVNHTTSYTYNARGQVTTITYPVDPIDGVRHTTVNAYNNNTGTLTSVTDELGRVTSYTYDDYRSVTTAQRFAGDATPRTSYTFYDGTGIGEDYRRTSAEVTFIKAPGGEWVKTTYDPNLRKTAMISGYNTPEAATTNYGYDNVGNLTTITDPRGNPAATAYDQRNRPMSMTDALANTTTFKYDAAGRKKSVTRANGQVTTYDIYDAMNRLRQKTVKQTPNPDAVTKYGYDATGLLQTMQDPRLVATGSSYNYSYDYDLIGRKLDVTYPPDSGGVQRKESYRYDIAARLQTFTNRAGNVQTFSYDALHRQTGFSWNDGGLTPSVSFGYDVAGWMLKIENANATITRSYYNDNLFKSETTNYADNLDRTVTYIYDADGRRANIEYPNGAYSFDYTYTSRNQLKTIQNSSASLPAATYDYDLNGNLTTRTLNNDTSSTFTYDALNRMTNLSHALSGTARTISYGYDNVSRRTWSKRSGGSGDVFGYDLNDQVTATKLNIPNPDTTAVGAPTISYDANGNRTSFAPYNTTETYTTNNLNQYSSRNSSQAVYDTKGNMTTGLDGSTYTYDAQNRLLTATLGSKTLTFTYDGLNRQASRRSAPGATPYYKVYDGWDLIGDYASGSTAATNAYLFGTGGIVKNLITNRYYYQDASGSTSHLASNSGGLLEWYWYDLQGEPIFYNAGGTQISASAYAVRHLFTGQQWHDEVDLYDLRNRFYSPDAGRFLQPDPIGFEGDPTNLYRYCGNDPGNESDPMGLKERPWPFNGSVNNRSDTPGIYYTDSGEHHLSPRSSTPNSPFNSVDVDAIQYNGRYYNVPGGQFVVITRNGEVFVCCANQGTYAPAEEISANSNRIFGTNRNINWNTLILNIPSQLNNPAALRAIAGGANPNNLIGSATFDSQAQNALLMAWTNLPGGRPLALPDERGRFSYHRTGAMGYLNEAPVPGQHVNFWSNSLSGLTPEQSRALLWRMSHAPQFKPKG